MENDSRMACEPCGGSVGGLCADRVPMAASASAWRRAKASRPQLGAAAMSAQDASAAGGADRTAASRADDRPGDPVDRRLQPLTTPRRHRRPHTLDQGEQPSWKRHLDDGLDFRAARHLPPTPRFQSTSLLERYPGRVRLAWCGRDAKNIRRASGRAGELGSMSKRSGAKTPRDRPHGLSNSPAAGDRPRGPIIYCEYAHSIE